MQLGRECSLTLRQALITPWKKVCGDCAWSLPIPAYFGDFDKEQEETQHTPSGSSVQRRFIVSVLTGTPFLWQWTMFLLIHYFVLLQSWGQEGFWTEVNLSLGYAIHHQLSYWSLEYFKSTCLWGSEWARVVGDNTVKNRGAKQVTRALIWLFSGLCEVALVKITAALC